MKKLLAGLLAAFVFSNAAFAQSTGGPGSPGLPNSNGSGGGGGGSGTVTSIATTCGVSGGPITTSGTISAVATTEIQTGTNYAFLTADCGKIKYLSNASNQVPTIPVAGSAGFPAGWFVEVCNTGAGTQTITPASGTIGGAATYVLGAGSEAAPKCIGLNSDAANTNYKLDLTGPGSSGGVSTTGSPANGNLTKFSGASSVTNGDLSGDCTTSGTLVTACRASSPVYVVNNWYLAGAEHAAQGAVTASGTGNNNTISCYPEYFHGPATISTLGANVGTLGVGNNYQLAVYANNAGTFRPTGNALTSSGSLSTTLTGVVSIAVTAPSIGNQLVWWCANSDNATPRLNALQLVYMAGVGGSPTQANLGSASARLSFVTTPQTFGTWPDLTSATWTEVQSGSSAASVQFKIGSVP